MESLTHPTEGRTDTLKEALFQFFNTNYSAHRMGLVIMGPQPLSDLMAMAQNYVGGIPKRECTHLIYSSPMYSEHELKVRIPHK
jgi:secreted Zn-dependent insulinase-like peptidase